MDKILKRLDLLVIEKCGFSREYAQSVIENGHVLVNGKTVLKSGAKFDSTADLVVNAEEMKYVSRGGYKLEKAFADFGVSVSDKICVDIGASTGGFTDCMLLHGAKKVYAIDSGSNQLSDRLIKDCRVISMENTDIRKIDALPETIEFAAIDVSFISVKKVLPSVLGLLQDNGLVVALIKPQFEVGPNKAGKSGIVRDRKLHIKVLIDLIKFFEEENLKLSALTYSPITGQNGNIEYFGLIRLNKDERFKIDVKEIVENAFSNFKSR